MAPGDDDRLIDEALRSYVPDDEPAGLMLYVERRVSQRSSGGRKLAVLSVCGAAAASVLLVVALSRPWAAPPEQHSALRPVLPQARSSCCAPAQTSLPAMPETVTPVAAVKKTRDRRLGTHALPKLAQFPAPSALTAEEQAVRRVPALPAAAQLLAAANRAAESESVEPIQIDPL